MKSALMVIYNTRVTLENDFTVVAQTYKFLSDKNNYFLILIPELII